MKNASHLSSPPPPPPVSFLRGRGKYYLPLVIAVCLPNAPTFAQEDEQVLEEVVVTGSRIPRKDLYAVSPVNVVSTESIELSGVNDMATLLNELPSAGVPGSVDTATNFRTTTTGLNTVDLRNLGEARTLVLVNGRRHVGGSAGSPTVDISMIPSQLVERVEIVTGGASAVYGSEAISGVINFIMKDDFEGVELYGRYGDSDLGGAEEEDLSLLAGSNFADGRGNATIYIGYSDQGILESKDRDLSANDARNSSFGPKGNFFVPSLTTLNESTGQWDKSFVAAEDGFNRNQVRIIRVPTKRTQFNANLTYEINKHVNFFSETGYNDLTAFSRLEPTIVGEFISVGDIPNIRIPIDNSFIPDELKAARLADDPDAEEIRMYRRFVELGPRTSDVQRRIFRTVFGINGALNDNFDYEVYYQYGNFSQDQTNGGVFNTLNFYNALRTTVDEDGELRCRRDFAHSAGCVPLNVFGRGSIAGDALDWVNVDSQLTSRMKQRVASASIFGTAMELPAGPLGIALGVEWREEKSRFNSDSLAQSGLTSGNTTPNTVGKYDVTEYFVEAVIPLLTDMPGIEYLGLEVAARAADYSTVGNTESYKASVDWRLLEGLRFRGGYSTAVRAPNIDELFDPGSETFRSFVDPCALGGVGGASATGESGDTYDAQTPEVQARCATIAGTATLDPFFGNIRSAGGFSGGNPNLTEESADTYSYGFVYSPIQVPSLNITVDYFNIEITDAINGFSAQTAVDQCVRQGSFPNNAFCSLISRDPVTGLVLRIDNRQINVAEFQAAGVDIAVDYSLQAGPGDLRINMNATHSLKNDFTAFAGDAPVDSQGEIGVPDWKANINFIYDWANFRFGWSTRYLQGVNVENDRPNFGSISSFMYHDIQVRYTLDEKYEFYVGIDNIFDEEPPELGQGIPGDVTGTNTAADVYDVIRQYGYAGFKLRF